MTFKVGIVSSYDVLCGNATYSQVLLDGLSSNVEAVKIQVPVKVQKFRDAEIEKQILQKVSDCDAVNIQMELGLYGATPKASAKLLKKIIKSSKRVSLTMHRVEERQHDLIRRLYNRIKSGKLFSFFSEIVIFHIFRIYKEIISYAFKNNATFIVHTYRERERILAYAPKANIIVHPIVWPDDYCVDKVDINRLNAAYHRIFAENKYPIIGLFGFISDYKNFLQVVRVALNTGKWRILIAGGTHPQNMQYGKHINYIEANKKLSEIELISNIYMNLDRRKQSALISIHSPEDPDLVHLIKSVDVIAVPYTEVGQSASGIASLAVQFGKKIVFSDTFTSRELCRFLSAQPVMFDTRSDASLASALQIVTNATENTVQFNGYSFSSNIAAYLNSLEIELDQK